MQSLRIVQLTLILLLGVLIAMCYGLPPRLEEQVKTGIMGKVQCENQTTTTLVKSHPISTTEHPPKFHKMSPSRSHRKKPLSSAGGSRVNTLSRIDNTISKSKRSHNSSAAETERFSAWSAWSKCSKKCLQIRRRQCMPGQACTRADLRQQRSCRKGRCRKPFHVVLPPRKESLKQPSSSDVRFLLSLNSIFYSPWSRWSPCTQSCTTSRYRTCRFPVVCGDSVLHEEAFCYAEGTDCEKWYSHKNKSSVQDEALAEEEAEGFLRELTEPSSDDLDPSWFAHDCGVPDVTGANKGLRIIGGREAAPGRWPWQVAILNRFKEAFCGGTLVGNRWVLTAAHCLRKRLYVRVGEHDLAEDDGTEVDYRVEEAFVHPDYDAETVDNDVALLRLPEPVKKGTSVRLACLPRAQQSLPLSQKCTIIGWGKERSTHVFGTEVLHEAEVPIVKTQACREVYEDYYITDNMFCAGYRKGRIDSCAGDSGGPLLCQVNDKWTIFGITSFGEGCGKRGKYGIYTKVPNYVSWLRRVMSLNGDSDS